MRIWESLSNTMFLKPVSTASSIPLHAANASTSSTVDGRGIRSDSEAITCPCSFLITTPRPAVLSAAKRAPSTFTLYWERPGGCQLVGGRPTGSTRAVLWCWKSPNCSLACCTKWAKVVAFFPILRLFLRVHKAHTTIANKAGSLFSAKTVPNRSIKVAAVFKLSWLRHIFPEVF